MWKFLSRILRGPGQPGSDQPGVPDPSSRVRSVLRDIDDGVSERSLPTLVCRRCGLKYSNMGTYLNHAKCPDCFSAN